MAQFDPNEKNVDEVLARLERANDDERQRILKAEQAGKARKSILEPYGLNPDARVDASGRELYPWEVTGDQMADANRQVEETDEQRAAREAQLEQDQLVAGAAEQGGATPAGVGVAPAADNAPAGDAVL